MALVFITPVGPLAGTSTPIEFELDREALTITIEFQPQDGADPIDWLAVYGDTDDDNTNGRFSWRFSNSERDGNEYTIRPPQDEGPNWRQDHLIKLCVDEMPTAQGVGGGGIASNLKPILDPTFWYVLDSVNRLIDQSGHGYTLTEADAYENAAGVNLGYVAGISGIARHTGKAIFRTAGAVSWVSLINLNGQGNFSWLCGCEDNGASYATWWKAGVDAATGQIFVAADHSGVSDFFYVSAPNTVPSNGWVVVGVTRDGAGQWTGFINGVPQLTVSQGGVATGGANAYLFIGQDGFGNPARPHAQQVTAGRIGGWTADQMAVIAEALLGKPPDAKLQPLLYEPVVAWALQGAPDTDVLYADRTGNGLDLVAGNGAPTADLIAGQLAVKPQFATRLKTAVRSELQFRQAFTITARLRHDAASYGQIVTCSSFFGGGDNTRNTLYSVYVNPDGTLGIFYEKTAGVNVQFSCPTLFMPVGQWCFYSITRSWPTGVVTIGLNGSYWSSGPTDPTSGGENAFVTIGDQDEAPDIHFDGAMADIVMWNQALTPSQLLPLYKAAMGL